MSEDEAREWVFARFGASALATLTRYVGLLQAEASVQSLIARSTWRSIWVRHIVDSAQLLTIATPSGPWIDIGSGAGLPGIVVAVLRPEQTILIEPRRKRAEFLRLVADELSLRNVKVVTARAQAVEANGVVISARAVASPPEIFAWTARNVSRETVYLLPRGCQANADVEIAARSWHGLFHVEQSLTEPNSGILIAREVVAR